MHSILVDEVRYSVDSRTYSIICWLIEHADEMPDIGNLQLNLKQNSIAPQILQTFKPIEIVAS